MTNNWIKVLKEYNKDNKNEWCVPKKGSDIYNKLKKRQKALDNPEQQVSKIQALVKGVQFRTKQLPKIIYAEELKKSKIKQNPYYALDDPEEFKRIKREEKEAKRAAKAAAKQASSAEKARINAYKKLTPQSGLSYAQVISRPKVENVEYLKRKIAEENKQRSINKYSNLKINYLM